MDEPPSYKCMYSLITASNFCASKNKCQVMWSLFIICTGHMYTELFVGILRVGVSGSCNRTYTQHTKYNTGWAKY